MTTNSIQRLVTVLLFSIIVAQFVHAQAFPWSVQAQLAAVPGGTISFTKIDAPDTVHAMALGFGGGNIVVCRTTDGGATWDQPLQRWAMEFAMHDLSHPTPNVAVIVGDTMFRDTGSTIFYTHNGGDTWQQGWCDSCKLADGSRYHLWNVSMCDSQNGILTAYKALIARTTDGGATWRRIKDPSNGALGFGQIQCLSPGTYLIEAGSRDPVLYRTDDSGKTWTFHAMVREATYSDFTDSLHGWAVGSRTVDSTLYNMVAHTANGGATWDTVFSSPFHSRRYDRGVHYLSMADKTHGIAVGDGGDWIFTTNGTTWQEGPNLDSIFHVFNLTSITYPHPDKAWATDVQGHILVYRPRTAAVPVVAGITAAAAITAFPNPVISGGGVSIAITLPRSVIGSDRPGLSLVDARGATVATIEQPITSAAMARFAWSLPAEIPAGVYFLRLVNGPTVATLPLTVMH